MLGAKCEGMALRGGQSADDNEESQAGVREGSASAMDKPEASGDFEFGNGDLDQLAAGDLRLNGQTRDQSNAVAESDEALNGFETGKFDGHVERGLMAREGLNHALAQG